MRKTKRSRHGTKSIEKEKMQLGPSMAFARAAETRLHDANPGVGGGMPVQNSKATSQQNSMSKEQKIAMMMQDAEVLNAQASKERLRVHAEDSTEIATHTNPQQPDFVRAIQQDMFAGDKAPSSLSDALKMRGRK